MKIHNIWSKFLYDYKLACKNNKFGFVKQVIFIFLLLAMLINLGLFINDFDNIVYNTKTESAFDVSKSYFLNKVHFLLPFWCHWQVIYITITLFWLCIIENKIFINKYRKIIITEKQHLRYIYIKVSSLGYSMFTFFMYNSLLLIYIISKHKIKLITDDPKSISSITEHTIMPLIFLIYFIISYRKSNIQNKFTFKTYLKFIGKLFIMPFLYIVYVAMSNSFIVDFYPYNQLDPAKTAHVFKNIIKIFMYTLILSFLFTIDIILLNIPYKKVYSKIFYLNKKQKKETTL